MNKRNKLIMGFSIISILLFILVNTICPLKIFGRYVWPCTTKPIFTPPSSKRYYNGDINRPVTALNVKLEENRGVPQQLLQ